jgi:hypothetical protein
MSVAMIGVDGGVWVKTDTAKNFSSSLTGVMDHKYGSGGVATTFLFLLTRNFVLRKSNSFDLVQYVFPFYAFIALWIATFAIIYSGLPAAETQINELPGGGKEGGGAWVAAVIGFFAAILAATVGNWYIRKSVKAELEVEAKKKAFKEQAIGNYPEILNSETVRRVKVLCVHKNTEHFEIPQKKYSTRRTQTDSHLCLAVGGCLAD